MHTFLNPQVIVNLGVGNLSTSQVLGGLFRRLGVTNFPYVNAVGRSVDFELPTPLVAREYELDTRTNPIVLDELTERLASIKIDKHYYSAVAVTDEQLTWDIGNFAARVLNRQTKAVADKCEGRVADVLQAEVANALRTVNYAPDGNPFAATVSARQALRNAGVDAEGLVWIVGADVEADILNSGKLTDIAAVSGDQSTLRSGVIGKIGGFEVVPTSQVDPDFSVFASPTALGIVNVAPVVPDGAKVGAVAAVNNYACRWMRDYDAQFLRDRSIVSTFFGATGIRDHQNADGTLSGKNARLVAVTRNAS